MEIIDELKTCPLFYEMSDKEIQRITGNCSVYRYRKGQKIFSEGDEGEEIFVLLEGKLAIQKVIKKNGTVIPLAKISEGEVFGEQSLIEDYKRSAEVEALERSFVLGVKTSNIINLYQKDPKVFGLLFYNLARLLTEKVRSTNKLLNKARDDSKS